MTTSAEPSSSFLIDLLDFFVQYNDLFSSVSSAIAILTACITILVITFVQPARRALERFLKKLGKAAARTYLGLNRQTSQVDAIADNTTWTSIQSDLLSTHQGDLLVITRSSPFAHDTDTYLNRLLEFQERLKGNNIRNAMYIISLEHLMNLHIYGKWSKKRLLARLKSLLKYMDLESPQCVDPTRLKICDSDFYFTYGIQIYLRDKIEDSSLIFYIEQENGDYGASFVVSGHLPLIQHQRRYFQNWFNKLSGALIAEAREHIGGEHENRSRDELLRVGLCERIRRKIEQLEREP